MSVRWEILLLILACMAVTLPSRIVPMTLVNRIRLPHWFLAWLEYIPVAVIASLFFPQALLYAGTWRAWDDPYLLAAFPTLAIALFSRNLFAAIIGGMVVFSALRFLL